MERETELKIEYEVTENSKTEKSKQNIEKQKNNKKMKAKTL